MKTCNATLEIDYVSWGGQFQDRRHLWQAVLPNGDVWDYGDLASLEREAQKKNIPYTIYTNHRNGMRTIRKVWMGDANDLRRDE